MLDSTSPHVASPPDSSSPVPGIEASLGGPCDSWFGAEEMARWSAAVAPPVPCRVARGTAIVREGAAAHHLYIVQAGDFKVSRTAEDGYEQVLDFAGASDVIGLDGLVEGRNLGTVEALQDSTVYAVPVGDLGALRATNAHFDARLQRALAAQWSRMRDVVWLMAAVGADRRTGRFLLQLSQRMAERGRSPRRLYLQMSRRDIAAHLGLAHESISRALTNLAASGVLRVKGREVEILDMDGLARLASSTRGSVGEPDTAVAHVPATPCPPAPSEAGACAVH